MQSNTYSVFLAETILYVLKPDPIILAQSQVYIQWLKCKKLQLVVGGYAYLLPWTTVVLRCPTRHFRKGHVRWLKEGMPLLGLPRLSVTPLGHVKIKQLRASDAGIYTCVAGQAREDFVLRLIGGKQKLPVPERADSWPHAETAMMLDVAPTGVSPQGLSISLNRYDNIVEHLLALKGTVQDEKDIVDKAHSSEKNRSTLEDERGSSEHARPLVLIADTRRLDEITLKLSDGLGGPQAEQLIAKLLSELTMTQGETNESPKARARGPVIVQRPRKGIVTSTSEMIAHVGTSVLLQEQVVSLELRCEALGNPEPTVTWTKNRKELHYDNR